MITVFCARCILNDTVLKIYYYQEWYDPRLIVYQPGFLHDDIARCCILSAYIGCVRGFANFALPTRIRLLVVARRILKYVL